MLEAVDTEAFVADVEALMREARETLASTRALLDEVRDPEGQTMQLVARLGRLSESIERAVEALQVEETGRELRKTAQAFSGVAAETAGLGGELQSSLRALREAALAVHELAETLKRDPGALLHGRQRAAGPPGD